MLLRYPSPPWSPMTLVESLHSQVVNTIDKDFSLFAMHMTTSHHYTEFAYDVCLKASAAKFVLDLGRKISI